MTKPVSYFDEAVLMDVMVSSISRSGNIQPQPGCVQMILPDRECWVWLGHGFTIYFPSGKQ